MVIPRPQLLWVGTHYAATNPGYFLYFPSRARRSAPLRLFIETARSSRYVQAK